MTKAVSPAAKDKQPAAYDQVKRYKSSLWAEYRKKVISLDGGVCRSCGRSPADGVVLQVHHTTYIVGRAPWEYPYDACSTLCKGCHAVEHGIIPPKFGWEYAGYDDLGGLHGNCECCDNLTSSSVATNFMESQRRHHDRLKRFVSSSRWVNLPSGTQQITQKKICLEIVSHEDGFKIRMDGVLGKLKFPSSLDAKMKAFDAIESGQAKSYLRERRRKRSDWM